MTVTRHDHSCQNISEPLCGYAKKYQTCRQFCQHSYQVTESYWWSSSEAVEKWKRNVMNFLLRFLRKCKLSLILLKWPTMGLYRSANAWLAATTLYSEIVKSCEGSLSRNTRNGKPTTCAQLSQSVRVSSLATTALKWRLNGRKNSVNYLTVLPEILCPGFQADKLHTLIPSWCQIHTIRTWI